MASDEMMDSEMMDEGGYVVPTSGHLDHPWQYKLLRALDGKVKGSKIHWMNATNGGISDTVEYLVKERGAVLCQHIRSVCTAHHITDPDIQFEHMYIDLEYQGEPIVIFKIKRRHDDKNRIIYTAIDMLRHGISNSCVCPPNWIAPNWKGKHPQFFDPPHVIVFYAEESGTYAGRFDMYWTRGFLFENVKFYDFLEEQQLIRADYWQMQWRLCAFAMCLHLRLGALSGAAVLDE